MSLTTSFFAATVLSSIGVVPLAVGATISCLNGGIVNPTNNQDCICLPGFAGPDCSQPRCGGNPFQGLTALSLNVSVDSCACPAGWTGTGCNVCTAENSCNLAFLGGGLTYPQLPSPKGSTSSSGSDNGVLNDTLVCNTNPFVFTTGLTSCNMNVSQDSVWCSLS